MHNLQSLEKKSDEELVVLTQSGCDPAFAELIRRHQSNSMKLAMSVLRDRSDAEDEVQNALWKAYEHIGQFQREARFSTWLSRIVLNQCLMRLRQLKRARLLYLEEAVEGEDSIALELPDKRQTPEEAFSEAEIAGVLNAEIRRIPPLLRNVFLLREVEGKSMEEVAASLGITVAAAKSRLLRARLELRARLSKHQPPSEPLFA